MRTIRRILLSFLLCTAIWAAGLFWFINKIPANPNADATQVDAIVVLTGGKMRLEHGLELLIQDRGKKLFITGVGESAKVADLLRYVSPEVRDRLTPDIMSAIYLGRQAENTIGNAAETAEWLQKENCHTIRLVTANYHMPRGIAEFRELMPSLQIISSPVFPPDFILDHWWNDTDSRQRLFSEYHKYVAGKLRHYAINAIREAQA